MATSLTAGVHDRCCFHGVTHHVLLAVADSQVTWHLRPACMSALGNTYLLVSIFQLIQALCYTAHTSLTLTFQPWRQSLRFSHGTFSKSH